MLDRLISYIAARHLGRRSHLRTVTAHDRIVARTKQLRRECGLGEHRGLA